MSALQESQHLKIPLKEIEVATDNFQECNCIGKGGFGMVYKGELSIDGNPTAVAVKRLNEQFGQGLKEFLMEIQLLTGQNHPNLISLIGYCDEGKEKIIVYEYAGHGSLDQYLMRNSTKYTLTWLKRLKICVDAARGLDHLHNHVGKHQSIIHRDIKSSNILLDDNWAARISDFGLSKLCLAGLNRSFVISVPCGTLGYVEPEYISTGVVKKESDVYSFGLVLFEVFCGRVFFIKDDAGLITLSAPLVKDYYKKKKLDEIVDPVLSNQMSIESKNIFSSIAYRCLHDDREKRPPMNIVKKQLEDLLKMEVPSYALETASEISVEMVDRMQQHGVDEIKVEGESDRLPELGFQWNNSREAFKSIAPHLLRKLNKSMEISVTDHPHRLVLKQANRPYYCSGCDQLGFGWSYICSSGCNFFLHEECGKPQPLIEHPFFQDCILKFRDGGSGTDSLCDGCGKKIKRLHYRCLCTFETRYLHPTCLGYEKTLEAANGLTLHLEKEPESNCLHCGTKTLWSKFRGWAYVSECKTYCYHVTCVTEIINKNWRYGFFTDKSDPFLTIKQQFQEDMDYRMNRLVITQKEQPQKEHARAVLSLIFNEVTENPLGLVGSAQGYFGS